MTTENDNPLVQKKTWFGITAVIEIHSRSFHRAGIGKALIPHPPVVNRLLRLGLPDASYYKLSVIHEFGHFQTLPVVAVCITAAAWWISVANKASFVGIAAVLLSILATAEILAEGYVRFHTGTLYLQYYSGVSIVPRVIFWVISIAITVSGLLILLR